MNWMFESRSKNWYDEDSEGETFAKRVSDRGELESPGLTPTGARLAILLPILISNYIFDVSDHPIITFCAAIFVIVFTLAPLTGLVWRLLKQKPAFLKQK